MRVMSRTFSSEVAGRRNLRISEVRAVVVTRTIALIVDIAAEIAVSSTIPSNPEGSIDVARNGTRPSGFAMNGASSSELKTP